MKVLDLGGDGHLGVHLAANELRHETVVRRVRLAQRVSEQGEGVSGCGGLHGEVADQWVVGLTDDPPGALVQQIQQQEGSGVPFLGGALGCTD